MDVNNLIYPVASLGGLGLTFGVLLGYASNKFAVEVDERVPQVRAVLPGVNCGGCGYAGCDAYAQAVADGTAPANKCTPGGAAVTEKIGQVLGVSVDAADAMVAFVNCKGTCSSAKDKYKY